MSLRAAPLGVIPEETVRVARRAFRKGSLAMWLRDELAALYTDTDFAALYPQRGQPAVAPWRLALVTVLQFAEGLTDRQAAEQVCGRIDWKYALGLPLGDPGFDFSVLCEFRERLLAGGVEERLLDRLLSHCAERDWLGASGRQRTDATQRPPCGRRRASIQGLNRLHLVGETLRQALDHVAEATPTWLLAHVPAAWRERYERPLTTWRLSRKAGEREQLAEQVGADGIVFYGLVTGPEAPPWLATLATVETLRLVWLQQYYAPDETGRVSWRTPTDLPPAAQLIRSPYDLEARFSTKRTTSWVGYKTHLTETCDPDRPRLITHVVTTPSTTADSAVTISVQTALVHKGLAPKEHIVDGGSTDAAHLVTSQQHGITLVGPVPQDSSWQARRADGFDLPHFAIAWDEQTVTCPNGRTSTTWCPTHNDYGDAVIKVAFAKHDCLDCADRARCTGAAANPRTLTIRPQAQHVALQAARQREQTPAFQQTYAARAGVEGTIAHATHTYDLRHLRYRGQAKAHLQGVVTAAAINVCRLWERTSHPNPTPRPPSPFAALMASAAPTPL